MRKSSDTSGLYTRLLKDGAKISKKGAVKQQPTKIVRSESGRIQITAVRQFKLSKKTA